MNVFVPLRMSIIFPYSLRAWPFLYLSVLCSKTPALKMVARNFLPRCIGLELRIFKYSIGIRLKNAMHLGKEFFAAIFSAVVYYDVVQTGEFLIQPLRVQKVPSLIVNMAYSPTIKVLWRSVVTLILYNQNRRWSGFEAR